MATIHHKNHSSADSGDFPLLYSNLKVTTLDIDWVKRIRVRQALGRKERVNEYLSTQLQNYR